MLYCPTGQMERGGEQSAGVHSCKRNSFIGKIFPGVYIKVLSPKRGVFPLGEIEYIRIWP